MKGRGVRVIDPTRPPGRHARRRRQGPLRASSTPSASPRPSSSRPTRSTASRACRSSKLLQQVAFGSRDPDVVSIARLRLARLDRRLTRRRARRARSARRREPLTRDRARHRRRARPRPPARGGASGDRRRDEPTVDEIAAAHAGAARRGASRRSPRTPSCASGSSTCSAATSR